MAKVTLLVLGLMTLIGGLIGWFDQPFSFSRFPKVTFAIAFMLIMGALALDRKSNDPAKKVGTGLGILALLVIGFFGVPIILFLLFTILASCKDPINCLSGKITDVGLQLLVFVFLGMLFTLFRNFRKK